MKVLCPKCSAPVPTDQVNVAKDLAYCPQCRDAFSVSDMLSEGPGADALAEPPAGAWRRVEDGASIIGASTRSPIALFLVPFMCVWSGGSLGGIYGSQIIKGKLDLGLSLFGIPFVLGTVMLGSVALMAVFGKVEVTVGRASSVFVGIGSIGWTRRFDWSTVTSIREDFGGARGSNKVIVLEGKDRLAFGTGLNESRRFFLVRALKQLRRGA